MIKTNLFKGDRVRLSPAGIGIKHTSRKARERLGTVCNDPRHPRSVDVVVHWDGNAKANRGDNYAPAELELVEDEDVIREAAAE